MASGDDNWRTQHFRQGIIAKIDDAIKPLNSQPPKSSVEMENSVFQKAKNREEYLSYVARIILHLQSKKNGGNMNNMPGNQNNPGITDPINALQNLATQGSRSNHMMAMGGPQGGPSMSNPNMPPNTASNLLQSLNQRPNSQMLQGMQNKLMPGMQMGPNQMQNLAGQMNNPSMMNQGPMQGQLINQLQGGPMPGQMAGQMNSSMMGQQNPNQMGGSNMPNQLGMGNQMPGQMGSQMINSLQLQQQRNANFAGRGNVPGNQYMSPSPGQVNSPAGMSGGPMSNQMIPSPVLAPSPGSQMGMLGGPRSIGMASSPGSSLPTPGQSVTGASPLGIHEDQAYRDKVRQLQSKYVEPLRKMISKCESGADEKLKKLRKLFELLSNPTSNRVPLETLLKCETALEKMDLKRTDGTSITPCQSVNPLMEALNGCLQSAAVNHTLQRTFGPSMDALNGPDIKNLPPPIKRRKPDESPSDIPDVLQGELARLDSRFKVTLDSIQQPSSRVVQLTCTLDDRHLPCVPPITVTIPEDYPKSPPDCTMSRHEYNSTKFLALVQTVLLSRISKLPKTYSVSQLLDTWEMSVRQASAPRQTPATELTVGLGL